MTPLDANQILQIAVGHHQAGQFAQAEGLYHQVLSQNPNHDGALHLLGVLALQVNRADLATDFLSRAVALQPAIPAYQSNLGNALTTQGKLDEAIDCYRRALALNPELVDTHNNLGIALNRQGKTDEAVACHRRALELNPVFAEAHNNLGVELQSQAKLDEAIAHFRRALECKPAYAEAQFNLGTALRSQGARDEARACFRRAVELNPNYAEAQNALGRALDDQKKFIEAESCYRRAIELKPGYTEAHNNLGVALKAQGKIEEAMASYRRAWALNPNYFEAIYNLGNALRGQERLDEAASCYRQALALRPNQAEAHNNLGNVLFGQMKLDESESHIDEAIRLQPDYDDAHLIRAMLFLLRGDFGRGWAQYEWRWRTEKFASGRRNFTQPLWDGRPLGGRTILLHAEQGLGDTLQFIRYVEKVAQAGGHVVVECQPPLKRLLECSLGTVPVIGKGQLLPAFDVHCPLLSLPLACGTTVASIPRQVPYLLADAKAVAALRARLSSAASLKVGLAWAGNKRNQNDHNRSVTLQAFAPLARAANVRFYSLQKGEQAQEALAPPVGVHLINWSNELDDFADTAALIANLDLVISVDTAVAHLAGALGKPVWTLLPFAPDWRWLLGREDSPWYPTMRLFRQRAAGDWPGVVARVADELARWTMGEGGSSPKAGARNCLVDAVE